MVLALRSRFLKDMVDSCFQEALCVRKLLIWLTVSALLTLITGEKYLLYSESQIQLMKKCMPLERDVAK